MAKASATGRWTGWVGLIVASAVAIVGVFLGRPQLRGADSGSGGSSILAVFAREAFDWSSSTTPAPLSSTAVLVKAILVGRTSVPELGLEEAVVFGPNSDSDGGAFDVRVGPVRDVISARILSKVKQMCASSGTGGTPCDPNEADPEFGTTPLHLAELWGSSELAEYLRSLGASPDTFDTVGRQPRNMTFKAFNTNSKKAADARLPSPGSVPAMSAADLRGMRCEIPEVTIPLLPSSVATAEKPQEAEEQRQQWQQSAVAALAEVRRLVSEGEPVMVRNVIPWLQQQQQAKLQFPDASTFSDAWGHRPVDVGGVPYAKNFDLLNERTTLKDYVASAAAAAAAGGGPKDPAARLSPNYVFQVDTEACVEGRELLGRIVEAALPSSGAKPIVCPPPSGLRGLESVHYYLGGKWSGAPFHIHSDALNLAVSGKKKWWVVTPRSAVWSKRHIREYAEGGKGGPAGSEDRPMECVQRGGDLVYVPGDWGHAAMNLEDETFG